MAERPVRTAAKGTIGILVIVGALAVLGAQFSTALVPWLIVVLVLGSMATDVGGKISVGYMLSLAAIFAFAAAATPSELLAPFEGVLAAVGSPFGGLNPAFIGVLIVASMLTVWVVDIRFISGSAKKPSTIVKRLRKRTDRLVDTHVTTLRLIAVSVVMVAASVVGQLGEASAEIVEILANVPLAVSNGVAILSGYVGLGGAVPWLESVPVLGDISPIGYLALMAVVLALAYGAKVNQ